MLGATGAGAVLGSLFALTIPTAIKTAPEPSWRNALPQPEYSAESYRFVEAGPIDADPRRWLEPPIQDSGLLPAYAAPDYSLEPEMAGEASAELEATEATEATEAIEAVDAAQSARQAELQIPGSQPQVGSAEPHGDMLAAPLIITVPDGSSTSW